MPLIESIVVPAAGSLITGLLSGALAQAVGWPGLPVGLGAALVAWLLRPGAVQTLPTLPEPEPPAKELRLTIVSEGGHAGDYLSLPIDPDRLRSLAEGLTSGRPLTSREWSGGGGLLSQVEFARLRGELIRRGLARWEGRDRRGGCNLTSKGAAVMRGLALPHPYSNGPRLEKTPAGAQTHTDTQKDQ